MISLNFNFVFNASNQSIDKNHLLKFNVWITPIVVLKEKTIPRSWRAILSHGISPRGLYKLTVKMFQPLITKARRSGILTEDERKLYHDYASGISQMTRRKVQADEQGDNWSNEQNVSELHQTFERSFSKDTFFQWLTDDEDDEQTGVVDSNSTSAENQQEPSSSSGSQVRNLFLPQIN
jgi:hypothetical protein